MINVRINQGPTFFSPLVPELPWALNRPQVAYKLLDP